ncbi:MAG: hypothetical protein LAN84_13350 [Acidobacteriia bacterium]|nr:hypothetical protein [Terriglobia bacterium]
MISRKPIAVLLLVVLPAGFAAVWGLQKSLDRQLAAVRQERDELVLRSGRLVNVLSLEYGTFLADVYWTRTVQYYGEKRVRQEANFDLLAPLLDLTTTLDPHLVVAYRFGAVFLAEPAPRGAGRPEQAVELIQRGIANNPEQWRLWQDLGFIYYWELRDYPKASQAFLEGSKRPGADEWMKVLAAKVAEEGRSRGVSMFLWAQIHDSTKDPLIRKNALNHLQLLKAEEDRERLDELVQQFVQRFQRMPQTLEELVSAGLLRGKAVDPQGYPYVLGADGKSRLHPKSPLAGEHVGNSAAR